MENLCRAFKDLKGFCLDVIGNWPCKEKLMYMVKELDLNVNLKALNLSHSKKVQIQENNVKKARNIYSWEKIVNDIIKIYQERHSIKSS